MATKINRDAIARAGLQVLDASGIEGVTLRALAAKLGVQAPTLYWHVKSKRDIFQAMAVAISQDAAARAATTATDGPWHERLRAWAHALRQSILDHRDGGRVFAGTFAADPATFQITEGALAAWEGTGLSVADAAQRTILLRHFIVGFCIEEQELADIQNQNDQTRLHSLLAAADPTSFPLTAQALPSILRTSADDRFELGVRLMLGSQSS